MRKKNTTPHSFHYHDLLIQLHPEVYDPAEDSFLLLETLQVSPQDAVLELGTGCGIIALGCALKGSPVVCSDINPYAVQLTRRNIEKNRPLLKGSITVRQGNLFSVLHKKEEFNVIIFNPPYLPTSTKEKIRGWFDIATDGGKDGLYVTQRFIHELKKHLKSNGRAYFIFSSLSKRVTIEKILHKEGFVFTIAATRRFEGEVLDVYCIAPTD